MSSLSLIFVFSIKTHPLGGDPPRLSYWIVLTIWHRITALCLIECLFWSVSALEGNEVAVGGMQRVKGAAAPAASLWSAMRNAVTLHPLAISPRHDTTRASQLLISSSPRAGSLTWIIILSLSLYLPSFVNIYLKASITNNQFLWDANNMTDF